MPTRVQRLIPVQKPRYALKVGVIGNRRFAGETDETPAAAANRMKSEAAQACMAVWEVVLASMRSLRAAEVVLPASRQRREQRACVLGDFFSHENPRLGVLSSLAAGADQIGAETALAARKAHGDIDVDLEAVLPFPEEHYPGKEGAIRPEFRPAEAATLSILAAQARQVVRLDGIYGSQAGRHRAYRHAREMLRQHADMLVAVYDPMAPAGTAGTVETVGMALEEGHPVVSILVTPGEPGARIATYTAAADRPQKADEEWARARRLAGNDWQLEVHEPVRRLLSLPHQLPIVGESAHEQQERLDALTVNVHRLRLLYGEAPVHRLARTSVLRPVFVHAWRTILGLGSSMGARLGRHHEFQKHTVRPESAPDDITAEPYASFYARASLLADAYMHTYRGAFVLSFMLAALAVAAAAASTSLSLLGEAVSPWIVVGFSLLSLAIIIVLLILERVSHQAKYQEHATDFRYLAELLRPMQWLAPLGTAVPIVELPAHFATLDPRRGWTPWILRAIARGAPLVTPHRGTIDQGALREVALDRAAVRHALERASTEWVQGQLVYHWTNAQRMHAIDDGLERFAKRLLWFVLGCASVAFLLQVLKSYGPQSWRHALVAVPAPAVAIGWLAAALPALVTALTGVMFQSEARRLKVRSEAMYRGLLAGQADLRQQVAALESGTGDDVEHAWRAAQRLRDLSEVMIEETADWKILYQTHEVHAG